MRTHFCSGIVVILCLGSLLMANAVQAATIRVAKDGTGDFEVIFDAVAAASSGDTISIGPGEYTETRNYTFPGGTVPVIAAVVQNRLTIIGDSRDTVVIGKVLPPAEPNLNPYFGILSSGNLEVFSATFRHLKRAVDLAGAWALVEDCTFVGNFHGVTAQVTSQVTVQHCRFVEQDNFAVVYFRGRGSSGDQLLDCEFLDNVGGADLQTEWGSVGRNVFQGSKVDLQVTQGGSAAIRGCDFVGSSKGLAVKNAQVDLQDSVFGSGMEFNISVSGILTGSGNELNGGTVATITFAGNSISQFHGNHILNGGGYSAAANARLNPVTIDLTGNYWGTTNTQQLDTWIFDSNDDDPWTGDPLNTATIQYMPAADLPIPTESTSFGRLKAQH